MALDTDYINNNVYAVVNAIHKMATGEDALSVVDTQSFVDYGNTVLSSNDHTETFMSTLMLLQARAYYTWRPYESSLRDLMITGEEWGAIYQKIDGEVGDFVSDETYELVDGQSVDQYIVRKPNATQKLFIRRSTYSNFITMSRKLLQGAFRSEADFASFAAMIFGKMRIKLDFATENMARLAIANYVGTLSAANSPQIVNLVSDYNASTGSALTAATALFDKDFLAYAVGEIELYSNRLSHLSVAYNKEGAERHTPKREQKLLIYDGFQSRLQHVLQYQAFHDEFVRLRNFVEVPYWQGEQSRMQIDVKVEDANADGGTANVVLNNIIGVLFDRFALGTFRSDEETLTTPLNARARYYNTFHFAEQLWYNDMSENFVCFTLN